MKTITRKKAVGVSAAILIAAGSMFAAAVPAQAATQGDRVTAPFVTSTGNLIQGQVLPIGAYTNVWGAGGDLSKYTVASSEAVAQATAPTAEFPAPGTYGPIKIGGNCLTYDLAFAQNPFTVAPPVTQAPCDGSPAQDWFIKDKTDGYGAAGAILTNANRAVGWSEDRAKTGALMTIYPLQTEHLNLATVTPVAPVVCSAQVASIDHEAKTAVVSGTGEPGATVTVTTAAGPVNFIVDANGQWSGTVTGLAVGANSLSATGGGSTGSCLNESLSVIINDSPMVDPMIAGGAGVAALALAGGLLVNRRRRELAGSAA